MGGVDIFDKLLDRLFNLTPAGLCSIIVLLASIVGIAVIGIWLLEQQFSRRTPAQRRDLIKLLAALRGSQRRDD